jgi:hypothetical protein
MKQAVRVKSKKGKYGNRQEKSASLKKVPVLFISLVCFGLSFDAGPGGKFH